jgi:uncharacterized protein YfaA (DUF2138 family)
MIITKRFIFAAFAVIVFHFVQPLAAAPAASGSPAVRTDLNRDPDAIISTKSLSRLPKDILQVPVLKDLLTEDFVFYYRDGGANWLSFRGALARIAFEKNTTWPLQMLTWILQSPAEIALWKSPDGRLDQFMLVLDQTGVKVMAEAIAKMAGDAQLSSNNVAGHMASVLTLPNERKVFLVTESGRLFIFSDASMKLPDAANGRSFVDRAKSFFGVSDEIGVFGPKLGGSDHVLTVSAAFLSFGYQAFFSSVRALRFDFKSSAWDARVLSTGAPVAVEEKDWSLQSRGAALCFALPFDAGKVATVVKAKDWLAKAGGTATACWYAESKFYSPVISVRGDFASLMTRTGEIKTLFTAMIGAREAYWEKPGQEGEPSILKWKSTLPVTEGKTKSGVVVFTREVGGRYGLNPASKSKAGAALTSRRFFRVKLAIAPQALVFSPDDALVDRTLTTLDGKYPSMASSLPAKGKSASFVLLPSAFSKLAKQAVLESLPESSEAIFRTAVSRQLFPNLDRFAKRPLQAASVPLGSPAKAASWRKLEWTTNAAK